MVLKSTQTRPTFSQVRGRFLLKQKTTFVDQETTEVQHRIRCAWSAFTKHRQKLTSRSYRLQHRLHLFDAVVTPSITYGAGSGATAKEHEKMLRTTQRRMLRRKRRSTSSTYCNTKQRKMDQESGRVEPRTQQIINAPEESAKTSQEMGRRPERLEKDEATEATQSNDQKNDTTWLAAATHADDWKKKERDNT